MRPTIAPEPRRHQGGGREVRGRVGGERHEGPDRQQRRHERGGEPPAGGPPAIC
ncbi:hypothetical protein [Streptomyces lucensis]|uniref:hypothetical protein n=1 Tax=Streptomyces lucensis TaxID=67319 RepID=UPI0016719AE8|nr:hypothetical protein [Streptomyces lucensis]